MSPSPLRQRTIVQPSSFDSETPAKSAEIRAGNELPRRPPPRIRMLLRRRLEKETARFAWLQ